MTKTKDIELLCDKHTHAGREYKKGEIIRGVDADSADWLISGKRATEVSASATKQEK